VKKKQITASEAGKRGARRRVETTTPEWRREIARKAAYFRWAKAAQKKPK
jgi:hypothetical protein